MLLRFPSIQLLFVFSASSKFARSFLACMHRPCTLPKAGKTPSKLRLRPTEAIVSRLSIGLYRNIMQPSTRDPSFKRSAALLMAFFALFGSVSILTRTDRVAAESTILTP
ncbi:hypothetical protein CIHG_06567 [Coccidioides immitis H538.4]|uniref:Uncharacterized protein n=3 Tax=Coccidioides immitis TaxID=5501 RepID=A0A0J8QIZ2_COCIT|nr:hypothetical protein CIRG_07981 [Coccidioides immitis RMSCC 2394]KMU72441.1 hypothetical protein CISG_03089 [Coccidioides immitis RMSCC 3703]KMU88629.1 hypothetical protein CIHG_06567 [Coccidioides immitis H538.4]